jgi:hypothetical protein
VHDALLGSLINALNCKSECFGFAIGTDSGPGSFYSRLHFSTNGLIALSALGIGDDALLLALGVCHVGYAFFFDLDGPQRKAPNDP